MRTHLQAKRNVFKWSLKLLLDKQHCTPTVSQMWLISTRELIYMHAKIKYNKTNAIKIKKKHTYTEAGIYKAAQRSVCPTEVKWNLGTHHHPPRHITFSYTAGSNEEQINKKMKATTYRNNSALGGSLLILSPRFCYCFSPLFFQFVKQLSVKFWDVNNVEHRQRSILLSTKLAQSPNNFIGNIVYKKLHLFPILLLVIVFFIPGHCACLPASSMEANSQLSLCYFNTQNSDGEIQVCNDSF